MYLAASPRKPACQQENSFTKITNIQNTVESAIWSLDDDSNLLTPHWTNTDGSTYSCTFSRTSCSYYL